MPEAIARADYDDAFMDDPPPKRRARSRAAARIEPTVTSLQHLRDDEADRRSRGRFRFVRTLFHRPLRTLVGLACAAIFVSFVSNLLFMQDGPHPAPLFAKQEAPRPDAARSAQAPVAPRAPEAAPRSVTQSANPSATAPAQQTASRTAAPAPVAETTAPLPPAAPRSAPISIGAAPPARPPEPAKPVAKQPDFDPIAQFLRTGVTQAPATTASTNASAPASADARRVSAAQRALGKLGHAIDADGVMGPGTRAAIQRFERDANLPVTGELNPRTVKALSARASIPIP